MQNSHATMRTIVRNDDRIRGNFLVRYSPYFRCPRARARDLINSAICQNLVWDRLRGDRTGEEVLNGGARESKRLWNYDVSGGASLSNDSKTKEKY